MLVGRKTERAALRALAERARRGEGGALVLTGDAGIGKTMLLDELAEEQRRHMIVLRTAGTEQTADLPFAGLSALLRPSEGEFDALPAPQAQALRRALGLDEGTGVDRLSVAVAVRGVLDRLSTGRPVLVIVDDVQWLDEPSRSALLFGARRLEGVAVAMVLARRSGELPEDEGRDLQTLQLERLRRREAQAVLQAAAGVSIDPGVRRTLLQIAEGNPLALTELPVALSADQLAGSEPLGEPVPVNGGLERAFGARIARLPDDARFALLVVAAAGPDASEPAQQVLAETGLGLDALGPAEGDGLVAVSRGVVTFRHPIVRSVVYHGQSPTGRRDVHARLAGAERDPDRRAWHRYAAAVAPDETVANDLVAVGKRGLARGAPGSAARAFEAAGEMSACADVRGRRLADAARAAHRAGDVKVAARVARDARELTSDPVTLADLLLVEADLAMRSGDLERAHRELTSQADRLIEVDRRRAATMLLLAAKLRIYQLEAAAAADEVDRALALLPEGEHELVHLVALSMSPDRRRTERCSRRGPRCRRCRRRGAARSRAHLGDRLAVDLARGVRRGARGHGSGVGDPARGGVPPLPPTDPAPAFRARVPHGPLGPRNRGCQGGARPLPRDTSADRSRFSSGCSGSNGGGARERRYVPSAGAGCACRRRRVRPTKLVRAGPRSLGFLALGARQPDDAVAPLETAERMARRGAVGEPWLLMSTPDLVEALVHTGRTAHAAEVLFAFEERSDAVGRLSASAAAARCRGILGDGDAFDRALGLHDRVPTPFERARTELCYGESLRRSKRRSEARELLRSALDTFEGLGAKPWAERARAELRASGERARRRSAPLDTLTAQERVVAGSCGEG